MAGTHSTKGPSGAKAWHACPGKLPFVDTLPDEQHSASSRAAQMGTAAHFLLEKCLRERTRPALFRGRIIELVGEAEDGSMLKAKAKTPGATRVWFEVDEDMVAGVDMAVSYVEERCEALNFDLAGLQLETRTNPVPERDDTSGTADVTIDIWPVLLEVVDYKNGVGLVEHVANVQLLAYLAGRAHDTGWSHDKYAITVVQPNAYHEEGFVRTFTIERADLQAFVIAHRRAAELVDFAAAELAELKGDIFGTIAGGVTWAAEYLKAGSHCWFCPAAAICPAKRKEVQAKAAMDFDDDVPLTEAGAIDDIAMAQRVLAWAPVMQAYIRDATAYLTRAAAAGHAPGWKLVEGRGKGVWADGADPLFTPKKMVAAGYITDNERALLLTAPALITGPAAEKLVPSKLRKEFRAAFMVTKPGKPKLVPADDSRPAVTFNPGDDFADDLGDD